MPANYELICPTGKISTVTGMERTRNPGANTTLTPDFASL